MYERGEGVAQDYVNAYAWFSLGLWGMGRKNPNELAKKMAPAEIAEAQELAEELAAKYGWQ